MQSNNGNSDKNADKLIAITSITILVLGVAAFYYFSQVASGYRIVGLILTVCASAYLFSKTTAGRKLVAFCGDARIEVAKVVWPTKQEAFQTTFVISVVVFVVGLILWILDWFLFWAIALLSGQKV